MQQLVTISFRRTLYMCFARHVTWNEMFVVRFVFWIYNRQSIHFSPSLLHSFSSLFLDISLFVLVSLFYFFGYSMCSSPPWLPHKVDLFLSPTLNGGDKPFCFAHHLIFSSPKNFVWWVFFNFCEQTRAFHPNVKKSQ